MIPIDTQLADRLAQIATQFPPQPSDPAPSSSPQPDRRNSTPDRQRLAVQANVDLAEAQRARAALEARAKELTQELQTLKANQKADQRQIQELSQESTALGKKVRDRDEELREKAKLLDVSC
jgi:DNA repair exonuclease SbcCD ATPase subunit